MNLLLIDRQATTTGQYFTIDAEGQTTTVSVYQDGRIGVVVHNAAHKVWRGCGKQFNSEAEAVASYKGGKTKAAILFACELAPTFTYVDGTRA